MSKSAREGIEVALVVVASIIFFFYVVHPILADVAPILTFSSGGDGEFHRRGGLGPFSLAATTVMSVVIYASIKYMIDFGATSFFSHIGLTFLVIIPDKYLPKKYRPKISISQRPKSMMSNTPVHRA